MKTLLSFFTIAIAPLLAVSLLSCGQAAVGEDSSAPPAAQQPFKKLTPEQTANVCQWITPEKLKPLFGLEAATFSQPRSAGELTFQCDQMGALQKGGVQVSFHLKPFDDKEIYDVSLEVAQLQKERRVPLGVVASITHAAVPGTGSITSMLQVHGSSYALDVSAQYQGNLTDADIEKALITLAKAFLDKNP